MCQDQAAHIHKVDTLARTLARFNNTRNSKAAASDTEAEALQAFEGGQAQEDPSAQVRLDLVDAILNQPTDGFDSKFVRARSDGCIQAQGV